MVMLSMIQLLAQKDICGLSLKMLLRTTSKMRYYNKLVNEAIETIDQYGDYEWFSSNEPY